MVNQFDVIDSSSNPLVGPFKVRTIANEFIFINKHLFLNLSETLLDLGSP